MCIRDRSSGIRISHTLEAVLEVLSVQVGAIAPLQAVTHGEGPGPVSYTHLDVYKRQAPDLAAVGTPPQNGGILQAQVTCQGKQVVCEHPHCLCLLYTSVLYI